MVDIREDECRSNCKEFQNIGRKGNSIPQSWRAEPSFREEDDLGNEKRRERDLYSIKISIHSQDACNMKKPYKLRSQERRSLDTTSLIPKLIKCEWR